MSFEVEYFQLTASDATNQYVVLSGAPIVSNNVALDTISGTAQSLNNDFGVDGTKIKWDGTYSLNGVLGESDRIRVIYDRS